MIDIAIHTCFFRVSTPFVLQFFLLHKSVLIESSWTSDTNG